MNNDFDKLLDLNEDLDVNEKALSRKINKKTNIRIIRIVLITLIAIAVITFGISQICNLVFYNPEKKCDYVKDDVTEFQFLMDIYTGLNYPGTVYVPDNYDKIEKHGFGSYTVKGSLQDDFHTIHVGANNNMEYSIKRGKMEYEDTYNLGLDNRTLMFYNPESIFGKYSDDNEDDDYEKTALTLSEDELNAIEELPESSYIKVFLSFNKLETMDNTVNFMKKYPGSEFSWIGIDSEHVSVVNNYDGIRLNTVFGYGLTDEAKKEYPELLLQDFDFTGSDLEQCYLSRIKLLKDNPDFMKLVSKDMYRLDEDYETVKKPEDVKAVGICGTIKKADFLKMIKTGEIKYVNILDVKLSSFN